MKTYEYILNDIQMKIEKGDYKPEEQLPSLRELSKIYHTTPVTAKKSLAILEERGYIYVVDRRGFFVSSGNNKSYTMIFHEAKSIDHLTDTKLISVEEGEGSQLKTLFGLEVPQKIRCFKTTRMLYNKTMPVGMDIKYILYNAKSAFPVRKPERLMASLNLVLGNYDIYKELEITILTDNTPVRDALFIGEEDSVFRFKQIYRTAAGRLVGVSETYVPSEEIQLKMKY